MKSLSPNGFISRISLFLSTHRLASLIFLGVFLIASVGGGVLFAQNNQPKPEPIAQEQPKPQPKPVEYFSALTGEKVDTEKSINSLVTAIMIENSPEARPQSGLTEAGVVYEAIAEGGITRFLALYQNSKPELLIGPVRSLRPYYVDWLAPYDAAVAHVGGSKHALDEIRNGSYRDIDQFFNAGAYWRSTDRYAPHNVYTNFEKLNSLTSSRGYATSNFSTFKRVDGKPAETKDATDIYINFSNALFNTNYKYNADTNTYRRYQAGAPHDDRENGPITPSVVVALHVEMQLVMEDGYREQITTTGSGKAEIFQNGTITAATWEKNDTKSPLRLIDAEGKEIILNRGQTWIAAVPQSGGVSW